MREDVPEFSRSYELRAMRHFVEVLRDRVGAPLSIASIARHPRQPETRDRVAVEPAARWLGTLAA